MYFLYEIVVSQTASERILCSYAFVSDSRMWREKEKGLGFTETGARSALSFMLYSLFAFIVGTHFKCVPSVILHYVKQ